MTFRVLFKHILHIYQSYEIIINHAQTHLFVTIRISKSLLGPHAKLLTVPNTFRYKTLIRGHVGAFAVHEWTISFFILVLFGVVIFLIISCQSCLFSNIRR